MADKMRRPNNSSTRYPLVVGGGMLILGAVASYVTLLYTPGPFYLLGSSRSSGVQLWALLNLSGGLASIGGGVAILLVRPRWSRVILFVMSGLGLAALSIGHLIPIGLVWQHMMSADEGGWQATPWHIMPHLVVAGGAAYLAYQSARALFDRRSPYRMEPSEMVASFAAIAVVVVTLGTSFYMENASWVSGTIPESQTHDVPLYQTIAVQTSLPATQVTVSYPGDSDTPIVATFIGENFVLVQPTRLKPGRQVVVNVASNWRTYRFTFYTREDATTLADLYLQAIHETIQSINDPWAPAFVGLETDNMAGLDVHQELIITRTFLAYSDSPYIHNSSLGPNFAPLSQADPLFGEFQLEGGTARLRHLATARDGLVVVPRMLSFEPGNVKLEITVLKGPDPNSARETALTLRYQGHIQRSTWVLDRID